jgi:hypothetical protein
MGVICFYCGEIIKKEDKKFMLGIEKPYCNIWFHRACFILVNEDLPKYLQENASKILEYRRNQDKNKLK